LLASPFAGFSPSGGRMGAASCRSRCHLQAKANLTQPDSRWAFAAATSLVAKARPPSIRIEVLIQGFRGVVGLWCEAIGFLGGGVVINH